MIEKNVGIEILRILYKENIPCPYGYEYSKCIDCPLYCETSITCDYGIDEEDDFEEYIEDKKLNHPLVLDCFECPFCDDINGCQFDIKIPFRGGE